MFANVNWRNVAERGVWTFVQAAVGTFTVANVFDVAELKSAGALALAAGVSALVSFVKNFVVEVKPS